MALFHIMFRVRIDENPINLECKQKERKEIGLRIFIFVRVTVFEIFILSY